MLCSIWNLLGLFLVLPGEFLSLMAVYCCGFSAVHARCLIPQPLLTGSLCGREGHPREVWNLMRSPLPRGIWVADLLQLGLWEPARDPWAEPVICSPGGTPESGMEAWRKVGFSCKGQPMWHLAAPGKAALAQLANRTHLCNWMGWSGGGEQYDSLKPAVTRSGLEAVDDTSCLHPSFTQ